MVGASRVWGFEASGLGPCWGFRDRDFEVLGFGSLGLRVWGLGFVGVLCLGFRALGLWDRGDPKPLSPSTPEPQNS